MESRCGSESVGWLIPVELVNVTRSLPLSVTSLCGPHVCRLRAVLESEKFEKRLPRNVDAILGTIVHDALRRCGTLGPDAVSQNIQEVLSGSHGVIRSIATYSGTIKLREVIHATRLSAKLSAARRFAAACATPAKRATKEGAQKSGTKLPRSRQYGIWREIKLVSEKQELIGQIDLLQAEPAVCTIIDFKSGRALSDSDELNEAYVDQVHYYLLLASANGYGPQFRLKIVAADGTFSVKHDEDRLEKLENRLRTVLAAAPRNCQCAAKTLASVSESCSFCSFRPWCGSYLEIAPSLWTQEKPAFPPPPDIWGTVIKVVRGHSGPGFDAVYLRDAASRLVCISGVPDRVSATIVHENTRVGFFSVQGTGGGSSHPQNFVLGVPENPRASSHEALVVQM